MIYSFIELRMITEASSTKEQDHVIKIKKNGDAFQWIWKDQVENQVQVAWLTYESLKDRLQTMIELMRWDADPYASVQVFLPAMPTVLISTKKLRKSFNILWKTIDDCIENWPENMTPAEAMDEDLDDVYGEEVGKDDESEESGYVFNGCCITKNQIVNTDREEGELTDDDTETETDEDMPALISSSCKGCPFATPQRPKKEPVCPNAPSRISTLMENKRSEALVELLKAIGTEDKATIKDAIRYAEKVGIPDTSPTVEAAKMMLEFVSPTPKVYRKIERTPNGDRVHTFFG
jgi:hypothetical protein